MAWCAASIRCASFPCSVHVIWRQYLFVTSLLLRVCSMDLFWLQTVVLIESSSKTYLPDGFLRPNLQKECQLRLSQEAAAKQLTSEQHTFVSLAAPSAAGAVSGTALALSRCCSSARGRLLVCGFVGRKGMKIDPTVCGRVTDFALRWIPGTTIVVRSKVSAKVPVFLVCVDGSHHAYHLVKEVCSSTFALYRTHIIPRQSLNLTFSRLE